jgi:hypothetical protein
MTSSEQPKYGLVLTIMEWDRLLKNGVVRIGDRIRKVRKDSDIGEIINLAPDLGESIDDYVFACMSTEPKMHMRTISPDNPNLRLLCLNDVESFHVMTQNARPNLEDRARSYGLELKDPMFDHAQFNNWQNDTRARQLAFHADRIKSGFNLPPSNRHHSNLIASAFQKTVEVPKSSGTPAYGWAVALKPITIGKEAGQRCKSILMDMQKAKFDAGSFFTFGINQAWELARELQSVYDQRDKIPLAGLAWINQIGHQHSRDQPPTSEAFSKSIAWLETEIGADWTASFIEAYCFATVKFDQRAQLAWPTADNLARIDCLEILTYKSDAEPTDGAQTSVKVEAQDKDKDKDKDKEVTPREPEEQEPDLEDHDKSDGIPAAIEERSTVTLDTEHGETEHEQAVRSPPKVP